MQLQTVIGMLSNGHHRVICPECSPYRQLKHRREKCLSVDIDNEKAVYYCHHCGEKGVIGQGEQNLSNVYPINQEDIIIEPEQTNSVISGGTFEEYLLNRGIDVETAKTFGVEERTSYFQKLGRKTQCLAFPFFDRQNKAYAYKLRSIEDKGFACSGSPQHFFKCVGSDETKDLWITEGEIDALSIAQCGKTAFSIPNGAPNKGKMGFSDEAFKFLWIDKDTIEAAEKVIIALDGDHVGKTAAEELARRIGKHKCWTIDWPEDCKDANDVLIKHGTGFLSKHLENIKPWPVSGLYDAEFFHERVTEIYEGGLDSGISTGYGGVDEIYRIVPGHMTIVTGNPGAGKSEMIDQFMCNAAESDGWRFAVCSFENDPRVHIIKLISKRLRQSFWEDKPDKFEFDEAYEWVNSHFSFLYHSDGTLSTLDSILERLRVAVMRYGISGAVIDPYNYILKDQRMSETDWISHMLTAIKTFCTAHDVHVWFIAHPTKPQAVDGELPVPKGHNISGSAAWWAKADHGLTVNREKGSSNLTYLHCWKVRFAWTGKEGFTALEYNPKQSVYTQESLDDIEEWLDDGDNL